MHEAFEGLEYDNDGNVFVREATGGAMLRGHVDSGSAVRVTVGDYGPRGGWYSQRVGGTLTELRQQMLAVVDAIHFAEDLTARRNTWLAMEEVTT